MDRGYADFLELRKAELRLRRRPRRRNLQVVLVYPRSEMGQAMVPLKAAAKSGIKTEKFCAARMPEVYVPRACGRRC